MNPPRPPTAALDAWHRRLRTGREDPAQPATWQLDSLWRAACTEQSALDALQAELAFARLTGRPPDTRGVSGDLARARAAVLAGRVA
jgi:hypothetical protein